MCSLHCAIHPIIFSDTWEYNTTAPSIAGFKITMKLHTLNFMKAGFIHYSIMQCIDGEGCQVMDNLNGINTVVFTEIH